jgi:hypothetical protein
MPSLTINACTFDAMEQRILADPRLNELLIAASAAIMTECFPHVSTPTKELSEHAIRVQDILVTTLALVEAESWPTRQIGTS